MQQQGGASTTGTSSSEHLSRSTSEVASCDQSTVAALPTASSSTISVLPDGRCFFRSVVISTNQHLVVANRHSSGQLCDDMLQIAENAKTDMLRASVMQFMCENVNQYASFTGDALNADMPTHVPKFNSLAARIKFMSDSTAMVGELEITATANLLKRPVHVSNNHHGTVYRYGDEAFTNVLPIHVKYTPMGDSCGHYEPVVSPSPPDSEDGQPSSQGGDEPSSTPERVRVTAISPIPVKQPKIMRRLSRATTAEILTASPYKTALSKAKARNARSGSQGKKRFPKPKPSSAKQTHSTTKQPSFKHKQTGTKKGESDWYCFICTESVMDDMIQCQVCNTWVHSACADVTNTGQFVCEPCQE